MANGDQVLQLTITEEIASKLTASEAQKLIKGMCIVHAGAAIKALVEIVSNVRINPNARVQAAQALLDRGFGKPEQNTTIVVPGSGKTGVMLVPGTEGRNQWLEQASAHHTKMLQ